MAKPIPGAVYPAPHLLRGTTSADVLAALQAHRLAERERRATAWRPALEAAIRGELDAGDWLEANPSLGVPPAAGVVGFAMMASAIREATERQQAQAQGRTVTLDDVVAMVRKLAGPVVMLDTHAPTHQLLVMEPSEFDDRRRIIMHPDTARMCWERAPLEATRLGIPDPDAR